MIIYPRHFEQKVGFDQVRELIGKHCISPMGLEFVQKIRCSSRPEVILKLLSQVSEFKALSDDGRNFPAKDYLDLREELSRLKTPGAYITQDGLFDLKALLSLAGEIHAFFRETDKDDLPELYALYAEVVFHEQLLVAAERIIDEKGEIRDKASDRLFEIRKQLEARKRQALKETRKAYNEAKKSGWVPDQAEITIREGRPVIPLHAVNKRAMSGIIVDESSTGQTVFVEPAISFELGNQIRELESEEMREIIKILTRFTEDCRPSLPDLFGLIRYLGLMDLIRAKALFSGQIRAVSPKLARQTRLELRRARHPLLYLAHTASGKEVVPLDLELTHENRILVISGPNAGGKSVCLKTIGLLQYMLQCGLPVSCSPDSVFPVFERIFIDIGDEQSLENDLSTYSSHLLNMKFFLAKANDNTLFLIDEFGTGTEPQLGGAIAEATLEKLNGKKAYGVVTTHYANLKLAAEQLPGVHNGAMLFDAEGMKPLFRLSTGTPGSSFAFEIARNIGFPGDVLHAAKKKTGGKQVAFDQQLHQMEVEKISLEKEKADIKATDRQLSEMVEKYTTLLADIKKTKKQMLDEAREEARRIIQESNSAVERTIREIREAGAEKSRTRIVRERLGEMKKSLNPQKEDKSKVEKAAKKIEPGVYVRVKDTDIMGELILLEGDTAIVDVNDVRLKTSFDKLEIAPGKPDKRIPPKQSNQLLYNIHEEASRFELSLDLRGKRADEAIQELQRYVDNALLFNVAEVSILHGKGDGILRKLVREYLASMGEVTRFEDAPVEFGGAGITKVFFR